MFFLHFCPFHYCSHLAFIILLRCVKLIIILIGDFARCILKNINTVSPQYQILFNKISKLSKIGDIQFSTI